ncbi:hypothetical protein MBLNU230_g3554t1 [Neophaeotheca triangularis]
MNDAHKIAITIAGDGGCGKSSLTLRLVRSQWTHEYDPTIEDSYSVTRTIDGVTYSLALTDTAGQEEYRGLWSASNLSSDAFLLVYDITSSASLEALEYFNELIEVESETRREKGVPPPVCIVAGNKCDLQAHRQVGAREGLEWARRRGYGFMETSAREVVNVEETFARNYAPDPNAPTLRLSPKTNPHFLRTLPSNPPNPPPTATSPRHALSLTETTAVLVRRTISSRQSNGQSLASKPSHSQLLSPPPPSSPIMNPTQPLEPANAPSSSSRKSRNGRSRASPSGIIGDADAEKSFNDRGDAGEGDGGFESDAVEGKKGFWRGLRCW